MKAYKVEVLILDFENYGADEIKSMFKNSRDIDGCVMAIREADIGTWSNDHPLNNRKTAALEYGRLFATLPSPSTAPMCERKTAMLEKDGYKKTGYVLKKEGEQICVSDGGAVAWFTLDQWNWLMFNRDHVEFRWPKPITSAHSIAPIAEDERAAFEEWARNTDQGYASLKGTGAPGDWYYFEDDAQAAWAAWQAGRRTPSASIGEDGLPELPANVAHVTRRIRRCESDVPAQVVFEHFARQYAREAIADDRRARGMVPSQMKEPSAGAASPQAAQGMSAADAVSLMLWMYRRLPRAYGRPPHVEMPIAAMAKAAGIDVADSFTERDPAPPLSSEQQAEKGDNACGS